MSLILAFTTHLALSGFAVMPVSLQGSGLCPGLSGRDRTACLRAEQERGRRELQEINRNNRNLDRARNVVCAGRVVGEEAAGAAGKAKGGALGGAVARGVFNGGAAIGDRALNNQDPCPR